ncbi:slit homolog 3 protein [Rhagoletis pomonella]|uniref:slit homolog 3 protein n=1 Tax=Rhagoletis pomonella TaxID=28610 RepID=UPI001786136A|nr:slit homolog 3 protein [Rhagoletis pomonella]
MAVERSSKMHFVTSSLGYGRAIVLLALVYGLQHIGAQNLPQQQVCPEQNDIAPCVCTLKKNGLDILCETTDLAHITKSMGTLKGQSPIIFYLKLRHNNLPKLQGFVFLALDIRHLTIHNSSLAAIEENALSSLGNGLTQLDVSLNQMKTVPSAALKHLFHLLILNLNHNKISVIHNNAFEGLDTLEILTLYENKITTIEPEAFRGVEKRISENLQYLRLGDNKIQSIPSDALRPLHRLRHLDLRNNNISFIQEDAFTGFGDSLAFLDFQKNDIKVLPSMIFENLNSLETLNIQNNKLSRIPLDIMEPITDTLRIIDITDNPLICSCELTWFPKLLQDLKNRDDEMAQKKKPVCHMPIENRQYYVQAMPLEKMHCGGISAGTSIYNGMQLRVPHLSMVTNAAVSIFALMHIF